MKLLKKNSLAILFSMAFNLSYSLVSRHVRSGNRLFGLQNRLRGITTLQEQKNGGGPKKAKKEGRKKEANPYAPTITLPETNFSQRANAIKREPEIQAFWKEYQLYEKLSTSAAEKGSARFTLHDGPPYANGDLHIGHALNKILKDFINRHKVLQGYQVNFVPGWDCHGLPIELKVLQTMSSEQRKGLTPPNLRKQAAAFAQKTVAEQSKGFQRYGVLGNWDKPYMTLQHDFEAAQIGVFGEMYNKGFIFRGRKPVHWSPSSRTALAEAELEYVDTHISKSIYVAFDVVEKPGSGVFDDYGDRLRIAIWTTTPWTLPANAAIAINPDIEYCILEGNDTTGLVVATDLVEQFKTKCQLEDKEVKIVKTFKGAELEGTKYKHPIYDRESQIVVGGDYVTTESGTGLVHTAPGHGQEDYLTGLKNGLSLLSPVDDAGKFTMEAGEDLIGLDVLAEGNDAIITKLTDADALLRVEKYQHKYPYDWRTKKPTIFRATDQWFASLDGFREDALSAIEEVQWVPQSGVNRIKSFVSGRGDWCISRQRCWGVPIPVFYDKQDDKKILLNSETIAHIKSIFAEHGSDAWWNLDEADLLPEQYKDEAEKWRKGTDTMDVWFDSGSSWAGVVSQRSDELDYPADLYLEGSDQHRGWFQSSLLTSVACNAKAPYKSVLTHGFVLDEKGYKMSKSLGNVVNPMEVIDGGNDKKKKPAYGADVLRLWVASVDYSGDVCIGDDIMKQIFESYRKLRNTARYLIGNLADYVPGEHSVPYEELPSLDKYILGQLSTTLSTVSQSYDQYQFFKATQELLKFASADLSNFYLDIAKDRLYTSGTDDFRRRSCQTVLHQCLVGLAKYMAPILPHMAEDIWQNLPYSVESKSVFEGGCPQELVQFADHEAELWTKIRLLRDDINKQMEVARTDKLIGASLDAALFVHTEDISMKEILETLQSEDSITDPPQRNNGVDDLRTILMISQVNLASSKDDVISNCNEKYVSSDTLSGCTVGITRASGNKCGRCWFYDARVGQFGPDHGDLCERCANAVYQWEERKGAKLKDLVSAETAETVI